GSSAPGGSVPNARSRRRPCVYLPKSWPGGLTEATIAELPIKSPRRGGANGSGTVGDQGQLLSRLRLPGQTRDRRPIHRALQQVRLRRQQPVSPLDRTGERRGAL